MENILKYLPKVANFFGFLIIILALLRSKKRKETKEKPINDNLVSKRNKLVESKNTIILIIGVSFILIMLLIKDMK